MAVRGPETRIIDAFGQTIIPGLIDTHAHPIREGLNYTMELRWDGVKSLKTALEMLREQAKATPDGQWVRVVGGWTKHQFAEKRLPTLADSMRPFPTSRCLFFIYTVLRYSTALH